LQEFTYLATARCAHTVAEQRRLWVVQYWDAADPLAVDGSGAESFAAFIWRVSAVLDLLAESPLVPVALFGHGEFMQAPSPVAPWSSTAMPCALFTPSTCRPSPIARAVPDGGIWSLS
jgi:broad specificity phosphatase PhoE